MPQRRATRVSKRAKPKKPDGDICDDQDSQKRHQQLDVFLKDFDMEVQQRLEKIEKEKIRIQSIIEKEVNVQLAALPREIRSMNIMDFIAAGGTIDSALAKLNEVRDDSFVETKTVKEIQLARKKKGKGGHKKKDASDKNCLAPQSALKSAHSKRSRFQTPASRHLPAVWDTPAVTPKFDINLPFTPGLARAPRCGERLMSLAGSPVDISAANNKSNRALKDTSIKEEEELDCAVSRVAAAVSGFSKADIHKILSEFTAATNV